MTKPVVEGFRPMSHYVSNLPLLFHEVRSRRYSENVVNALKFIGICFLALLIATIAMLVAAPDRADETLGFIAILTVVTFGLLLNCAFYTIIIFWPLLLYFWANFQTARQQTLLFLIQTAVETGKPLQDTVRAYASGCSSRYAARLQRFALALDSGRPLEDAVREHRGLFRYDVAAMIRLGGNAPETLRSLETIAQEERNFSIIQTSTIVRVVYLCILVIWMQLIMTFVFTKIVPEFGKIFLDFDTKLPAITTFFLSASQGVVAYWYLAAPIIPLLALAAIVYLILKTNVITFRPLGFRRIFRSTDSAKFLRVFAAGVRHRYPIPIILDMYRWVVPSEYLRSRGTQIREAVAQGHDWIDAVRKAGFITSPESALLHSAQRTGNTVAVLDQLAQSKERLQIRKDDLFSKMVFIPLIFLLGAVVGAFVVGMFMPLVALIQALV